MSARPTPERWTHYRLEDDEVVLVIGETADFVWVLDPLSGEQQDADRAEFIDGLMDGSIEKVRPVFETVDDDTGTQTQGAAA